MTQIIKLIDLVNLIPDLKWDYDKLSENSNIYPEDIKINEDNTIKPFSKQYLSNNSNLTFEYLCNNFMKNERIEGLFDWHTLSESMPISDIISYPSLQWWTGVVTRRVCSLYDINYILQHPEFQWDSYILSTRLPIEQIIQHPEVIWQYTYLSLNRFLTVNFIQEHPDHKFEWNVNTISNRINIKEIETYLNLKWSYKDLSRNETLTSEFVLSNIDKKWNWFLVFSNPNINYDILAESKYDLSAHVEQCIVRITTKTNLTIKFVEKYKKIFLRHKYEYGLVLRDGLIKLEDAKEDPELILNYKFFSSNPNLTLNYYLERKSKCWDMIRLSENKAFKMKDILRGIELKVKWNYQGLSKNPNITFYFIYINRNKNWNGKALSSNPFIEQKKITLKNFGLKDILLDDINNIIIEYMI